MTTWRARLIDIGVVTSAAMQLLLAVLGLAFMLSEDENDTIIFLLEWCVLGTLYAIAVLVVLQVASRVPQERAPRPLRRMQVNPVIRAVAIASACAAGLTGIVSVFLVLLFRDDEDLGAAVAAVGVWAMLLSWGLVHWGFAQWYHQLYHAAAEPPLTFPGTPHPNLVDFAYFAYTIGTTFATADVEVRSRRIRWLMTLHSVLSFFFNGGIIVLALNTLLSI
ncbi:DUF1345 domain-containing protein [Microbacterium luticocti]|uniref:DUF1345 domain-containing protein n=1 Tax=Microbacterium luticocti TaxID=451764 RepID=UPI0003F57182|nr:DUF1345 domain-containing protein [Microbacterium luticocti]